jgi:hypothetical protein
VKEYELYLPLTYNDGSPIESAKLVRIRERLLEQFGSLTFIPQERVGFWKSGRVTYQDRIVVYRITLKFIVVVLLTQQVKNVSGPVAICTNALPSALAT